MFDKKVWAEALRDHVKLPGKTIGELRQHSLVLQAAGHPAPPFCCQQILLKIAKIRGEMQKTSKAVFLVGDEDVFPYREIEKFNDWCEDRYLQYDPKGEYLQELQLFESGEFDCSTCGVYIYLPAIVEGTKKKKHRYTHVQIRNKITVPIKNDFM